MFNAKLNRLKTIFDRIESYDATQNIGFRSLKNIGVWLSVYAVTDEHDKPTIIHQLATAAQIKDQNEIDELKKLVDSLVLPNTLKSIITDYEKANGTFFLTVQSERYKKKLEKKMIENNLDFLLSHIKVAPEQASSLSFLMKNTIKFNWASGGEERSAAAYEKTSGKFCEENITFLKADSNDHSIHYGLVQHNNIPFHVVRLGTLQTNDDDNTDLSTDAFLIEPVSPQYTFNLQKDYFDIISNIKKNGFDDLETYRLLLALNKEVPNVKINGQLDEENSFRFIVRFPNLSGPVKTIEERLGIYSHFANKLIANIPAEDIKYRGERELIYDEKGGEIKNREEFSLRECSTVIHEPSNVITLNYTVRNPYMMVYDAQGADYYPYLITNPKKDLSVSFDAHDKYPVQTKFSNQQPAPEQHFNFPEYAAKAFAFFKKHVGGSFIEDLEEEFIHNRRQKK